jgi:NAD(P) transhydrogenase
MRFDLAVIGNDEAAIELGLAAATSNVRTVVVLPESRHSSWITSMALRRLVSGLLVDRCQLRRQLFQRSGTPGLIQRLLRTSMTEEIQDHARLLRDAGASVLIGEAAFCGPEELTVSTGIDCRRRQIEASNMAIATGTRFAPCHRSLGLMPRATPESLLEGTTLPKQLTFLGGGDFAAGLAAVFSIFGVTSTVEVDAPIHTASADLAEAADVRLTSRQSESRLLSADAYVSSGQSGYVVDCRAELGFTDHLRLNNVGIEPDERGQLWCSGSFETWCENVFGLGDVVGFGSGVTLSAAQQSARVLQRIRHRVRAPHFLRLHRQVNRLTELFTEQVSTVGFSAT